MRKINLFAVLLLAAAPLAANAADGTITFKGKVTDVTCQITTPAGKDFTVNLPTVSKASLATVGATNGRTQFAINLSKCGTNSNVATYFEPGSTVDFATGRLLNQTPTSANGAGNVQVQLLGSNFDVLPIKAASSGLAQTNSQWVNTGTAGTADLNYYAEYYATGAASAGEVSTSVKYTIIYH